jgi:allophanate hydrolase
MSWRDFAGLRAHYAAGASPMKVAEEVLQRIAAFADPALFITQVSPDALRARAGALTAEGPCGRPLWGIPFVVKDNIDVAGLPTTAGCPACGGWCGFIENGAYEGRPFTTCTYLGFLG